MLKGDVFIPMSGRFFSDLSVFDCIQPSLSFVQLTNNPKSFPIFRLYPLLRAPWIVAKFLSHWTRESFSSCSRRLFIAVWWTTSELPFSFWGHWKLCKWVFSMPLPFIPLQSFITGIWRIHWASWLDLCPDMQSGLWDLYTDNKGVCFSKPCSGNWTFRLYKPGKFRTSTLLLYR